MNNFNSKKITQNLLNWIKKNYSDCTIIIGISGGKDSSVVATLCVKALGKENVIGVLMPDGLQNDIQYSYDLVKFLNINYQEINIKPITSAFKNLINEDNDAFLTNMPARVRMTILYSIATKYNNSRVANTCNLSEDWVGYSTKFGDSAGDFSPLSYFTTDEVIEIGRELNIPEKFLIKVPADGMSGKSDEEKLGFSYKDLNSYLRSNLDPNSIDEKTKFKIDEKHKQNLHKIKEMPKFEYKKEIWDKD